MTAAPTTYERKRGLMRQRNAAESALGRDIAPLPRVKRRARKARCATSFRAFCEAYLAKTFALAWSADHLTVIGQVEESVLRGGLFATAMPRGSGKSSLAEAACVWAILYGHRDFVALIGSDEGHASGMLESIKTELEGNDDLLGDFPEACYPIRRLEGIAHRCNGQTLNGVRTQIGWTAGELVLATVPRSRASGAVIKVAGITGGLRGLKFKRPDGRTVRPGLVVVDDPQTDESARSPSQCQTRERILAGAVLGLAGPGKKISGIMPCTVIRPGDMADAILDRQKHPEWNGRRAKMVYSFPTDAPLWEEYARLRGDGFRAGDGGKAATEFYRENRGAMDAGARVAWAERFEHDEVSAIQHAMNLKLRDERAFWSEYQNEPLPEAEARPDDLTPDRVAARVNRQPRGTCSVATNRLTAFIDVQASLLYWLVCAWEDDFTGQVVDYGTFPDQRRPYFSLVDAKQTLDLFLPAAGLEGRIYAGLGALCQLLLGRDWRRDDGAGLRVERCLIDANWGVSTAVVKKFCRESPYSSVLTPSHGKYIGAAGAPMAEWPRRPGERTGHNWRLRAGVEDRTRSVVFDTNFWKSFLSARLSTALGDRGALTLFGDTPEAHRMLSDHLCAEYRVRTEGRGRVVDEFRQRPERPDNHLLDCLVGCYVGASMQGVAIADAGGPAARPKPAPVKFSEQQRLARGAPNVHR